MRFSTRCRLLFTAGAACSLAAGLAWIVARSGQTDRWYMPGPLGHERITPAPRAPRQTPLSPYLTRSIGLRPGEEQTWGDRNGLTPGIPFSHHLSTVFPRTLFSAHPEYFPLVDGKRFNPPKGPATCNPDLGREDVAQHAAHMASAHFSEHPDAVSYALGVNDVLIFGESPETVALTGRAVKAETLKSEELKSERLAAENAEPLKAKRTEGRGSASAPLESANRADPRFGTSETSAFQRFPMRWFRGRPDFSPLVFTFMNRAAAELNKTHPDKYLGCLAYYWCENVPPFSVDPHVIPFVTADRSQNYDPAFRREELDLQTRWARAMGAFETPKHRNAEMPKSDGATDISASPDVGISAFQHFSIFPSPRVVPRLGLYDYLDGYGFLVPRVAVHAFAEHIKHAHAVGFTDYYGESSLNWGLNGPLPWVIAQLLKDPDQDVDTLLDEYYTQYFKSAAEPMRRFFERCEQQWMEQSGPSYWLKYYRSAAQATLFPDGVCRELRTFLDQAAAVAVASGEEIVARRVAFVSNSFGVTERFVAFENTRQQLTTAILRKELEGQAGRALLADYLARRRDFIRYTHELLVKSPLAFSPINYDDWVRDDPTFAAELALSTSAPDASPTHFGDGEVPAPSQSAGHAYARNAANGRGREVVRDGNLAGPLRSGLRIAGLQYGIDLPAPWLSKVEPTEHGVAVLQIPKSGNGVEIPKSGNVVPSVSDSLPKLKSDESQNLSVSESQRFSVSSSSVSPRFLHVASQENMTAYQWVRATPGALYAASVQMRGRVTPGAAVMLTLGWLDRDQHPIGMPIVMRLPDGDWADWVTLQQGGLAPRNAAWVGIAIRVQHQVAGDFADFRRFSLVEVKNP